MAARSVSLRQQTMVTRRTAPDAPLSSPHAPITSVAASAVAIAPPESRKRKMPSPPSTSNSAKKPRGPHSLISSASANRTESSDDSEHYEPLKMAPAGLKKDNDDDTIPGNNCCICMCEPNPTEVSAINGCQHQFCFDCIEKWADRENTCPLCKTRFTKINRINKQKRKKGDRRTRASKQVKTRDQRSMPESALEGLLATFSSTRNGFVPHSIARIIFAGLGSGFYELGAAETGPVLARDLRFQAEPPRHLTSRAIGFAARTGPVASALDDSSMNSSDDEDSFAGIVNHLHRVHTHTMRLTVPNGPPRDVATYAARSYAVNMGETNAGNELNPLEIEDDSSDDEVEVVEVITNVD